MITNAIVPVVDICCVMGSRIMSSIVMPSGPGLKYATATRTIPAMIVSIMYAPSRLPRPASSGPLGVPASSDGVAGVSYVLWSSPALVSFSLMLFPLSYGYVGAHRSQVQWDHQPVRCIVVRCYANY